MAQQYIPLSLAAQSTPSLQGSSVDSAHSKTSSNCSQEPLAHSKQSQESSIEKQIQDRQNFWKSEIDQHLSKYKHLCAKVNNMLKAVEVPEEIQQKLPGRMQKFGNIMESKIQNVDKEVQEQISNVDVEFINVNYTKVKDFVTMGYNHLIVFLSRNGLLEMIPSKERNKQLK